MTEFECLGESSCILL